MHILLTCLSVVHLWYNIVLLQSYVLLEVIFLSRDILFFNSQISWWFYLDFFIIWNFDLPCYISGKNLHCIWCLAAMFLLAVAVLSVWSVFITTYRIRWIASDLSLLVFDKNTAILVLCHTTHSRKQHLATTHSINELPYC